MAYHSYLITKTSHLRSALMSTILLLALCIGCEPGAMIDPEEVGELIEDGGGDCDRDNDGVRAVICGGADCDEDNPQVGPCQACSLNTDCQRGELCNTSSFCTQVEEVYFKAPNADNIDIFGFTVEMDHNLIVVGAPYEDGDLDSTVLNPNENLNNAGAVYVYELQNGQWRHTAYLKPHNARVLQEVGKHSISVNEGRIAIGVPYEDGDASSTFANSNINANQAGAVYIFEKQDGQWRQTAYLKAPNAEREDYFGISVSLYGDRIAIGATGEDGDTGSSMRNPNNNALGAGATYIFELQNGQWQQTAYLKSSNAEASQEEDYEGDSLGRSISLDGDLLVVSAVGEDGDAESTIQDSNNNALDSGAAYVFEYQPNGSWVQTGYLKAHNPDEHDGFGISTSLSNNRVFIGAPYEDGDANSTMENPNNDGSHAGAVYVYEKRNGRWRHTAYLKASNARAARPVQPLEYFGNDGALSADGNRVVIGAPGESGDTNSTMENPNTRASQSGAAYVFELHNGRWLQTAYLKAGNLEMFDGFGGAVALDGNRILIRAIGEDGDAQSTLDNSNNNAGSSGAVYLYTFD